MQELLEKIKTSYLQDLDSVKNSLDFDLYRAKYNKLFSALMRQLKDSTASDKKKYGPEINSLKKSYNLAVARRSESTLASPVRSKSQRSTITDPTIPGEPQPTGRLHPTTEIIREMNDFFRYQGFSVGEGPEIENVEYNFRKLNLPEGHPATDLQDTLFVKEPDILMRTHTSSVETRILTDFNPPMRVVVPGKVYRNETSNVTNASFFYQYQGFVVDQGINIGHLKDILTKFHQFLFGHDVVLRFRYKYYPEVSPGMGVDMQCQFCHGPGCAVCKYRGWIEVLGSGMIHYNTLRACGIDPEIYTGYAFGMGLDRLVMSKYGIEDIRKLYGGEIVYR